MAIINRVLQKTFEWKDHHYEDIVGWLGRAEWHSSDLKHINLRINDAYRYPFATTKE